MNLIKKSETSVIRVKQLISSRANKPPLVVLMSSSSRLTDKRDYFRDEAGLLGSTFRVARKTDLQDINFLSRLLTRLANHYEDAQRVAAFVDAWDKGLDKAKGRFIKAVRRLDLSDLAQIQALLLDFEGQALGDYLLDVTDRVLQYEIEGDSNTISAAKDLNKIRLDNYPAPHLKGSVDLQSIVYRMLFQNPERLQLSENNGGKAIQFGDIYHCQNSTNAGASTTVLLVVTQACDLARCGVRDILVLPGTMKPLNSTDWTSNSLLKTSVITLQNGENHQIEWNLKGRNTISGKRMLGRLRNQKLLHLGRLREIYAIELQQQLFTDMARIGQIANLPASFPVSIALYSVSNNYVLKLLTVAEINTAACFIGRGEGANSRVSHLVLSESACDAFQKVVSELPVDDVHPHLKNNLREMKTNAEVFELFERGQVEVPLNSTTIYINNVHYLTTVNGGHFNDGDRLENKNHKKSPLLMNICEVSNSDD